MTSASRAGVSRSDASRVRRSALQLGMVDPRQQAHRLYERLPVIALPGEHAPAFGGEAVEAAAPLAGLLGPPALQPAALLEPVEQGIERRDVELEAAAGALLDQLADLVAVAGARLDHRQDDQLRGALFQLAIEHPAVNSSHSYICYSHDNGHGNRAYTAPARRWYGHVPAGPAVRAADAAPHARVPGGRHRDAGDRHRRHDRDLQHGERRPAEAAPVPP